MLIWVGSSIKVELDRSSLSLSPLFAFLIYMLMHMAMYDLITAG